MVLSRSPLTQSGAGLKLRRGSRFVTRQPLKYREMLGDEGASESGF
jgi:hypothetical protein